MGDGSTSAVMFTKDDVPVALKKLFDDCCTCSAGEVHFQDGRAKIRVRQKKAAFGKYTQGLPDVSAMAILKAVAHLVCRDISELVKISFDFVTGIIDWFAKEDEGTIVVS